MKKRTISLGFGFVISLFTTCMMAQSQVYVYGQLVSNAASSKLPEIVQVQTHQPLVRFDLNQPYAPITRTTLFNRDAKMNLSSVTSTENSRTLNACITSGEMPIGTTLRLNIETPAKNFHGDPGNTYSEVQLDRSGKIILSDVGTCFSGKTPKDGYVLEYSCELPARASAYESLKGKVLTVTITVAANL